MIAENKRKADRSKRLFALNRGRQCYIYNYITEEINQCLNEKCQSATLLQNSHNPQVLVYVPVM